MLRCSIPRHGLASQHAEEDQLSKDPNARNLESSISAQRLNQLPASHDPHHPIKGFLSDGLSLLLVSGGQFAAPQVYLRSFEQMRFRAV